MGRASSLLLFDPIQGGCANPYVYVYGDPVNSSDLPLVNSVSDPAGTITAATDLLGRLTAYTDTHGRTTAYSYDQTGRLTTIGIAATTYGFTITAPSGSEMASGQIGHKVGVPLDYGPHGRFKFGRRGSGTPIPPGSTLTINVVGTLIYAGPSSFTGKYECTF